MAGRDSTWSGGTMVQITRPARFSRSSLQHGTDYVICKVILTWVELTVNRSSSLACE